jgi:hypothetical protein
MELSNVVTTKLGAGNKLLQRLKAATPVEIIDGVEVMFATPVLPRPNGIHDPVARQNAETITNVAMAGKDIVEQSGVKIKLLFKALASASVFGPAEKIAELLERPEIASAISSKGVTVVPSPIYPLR